ncbi:MAG: type IV toxin-antitoxin system AbiEi family antitoxin domain-containing protein [Candidatus Berkiella sp.]
MDRHIQSYLNQLLKSWPSKTICLSEWFEERGISRKLVHYYNKAGWIERVGQGAYKRAGDSIDWPSGLKALQEQANLAIHLGGKSALQLQGFAHYIPVGNIPITLYGEQQIKLPAWFNCYKWSVPIIYHSTNLFGSNLNKGISSLEVDGVQIKASSPERAMMEMLYLIPSSQSYDEAYQIMGSLTAIRPELTQHLLENCTSIKVKRVFMVMAKAYNYPWLKDIDKSKINFGKGKRELIKGGKLDPEFLITVPALEDKNNIEV